MLKHWIFVGLAVLGACAANPEPGAEIASVPAFAYPALSAEATLAHVEVLASDEFEGRAPSSRGEELTLAYLERAFAAIGLQPGVTEADGTRSWRQLVPLVSAQVDGAPTLTITGADGAREYAYQQDFVAWTRRLRTDVALEDAPLVFVGYGVVAPERNWNDYQGVDMSGKVAVILINDPDFETGEDKGFGGSAMTYYGRWTYKYEEAARQGAAGAIIIHETAPASYPWSVVASSYSGARFDILREDEGMSLAAVEGWMTAETGRELFERAGLDFDALKSSAQTHGFRAVPMGALAASLDLHTQIAQTRSNNVVAVLPGRTQPDEAIVYSAHWDHLGHCTPVDGDAICNGALDNASGVAGLIELARRFAEADAPSRSVAFIALTAEEQGLLGSEYYAEHPTIAPANIVANINMDGLGVAGRSRDFVVVGYGKSEMDELAAAAAEAQGRRITPDPNPERGGFFRSDQFNFARVGVPVLYGAGGLDLINGGEARGRELRDRYLVQGYHKPGDEVTPDWDMRGAADDLSLLYAVGRELVDSDAWPQWRAETEFRATRQASRD